MNQTIYIKDDAEVLKDDDDDEELQHELTFCRHSNEELKRENYLLEKLYYEIYIILRTFVLYISLIF